MTMAVNAIVSLVALVLFVCFFYGTWQAACTDWARQIIFERRDKLFDMAAAGKLSFASDEYKFVRRSFEGMIRFAHELTWPRLLFFVSLRHRLGIPHRSQLSEVVARIEDPATRKRVQDLVLESAVALIAMMALKSIVVAPLAFVMWVVALCSTGFKFVVRDNSVVKNLSETIQIESQLA
jgi:hypothetical protein